MNFESCIPLKEELYHRNPYFKGKCQKKFFPWNERRERERERERESFKLRRIVGIARSRRYSFFFSLSFFLTEADILPRFFSVIMCVHVEGWREGIRQV